MPDIVLKDGTGDAQTIEGATALGVDTVDGGIAVFVSKDMIPEGYEHPSTHPASMITGLAGIATSGKYDDMKNKPFGDITVLPESTVNFSLLDDDLGCYEGPIEGIMDDIVEGETYIITWDGTAYSCVAKHIAEIQPAFSEIQTLYLGNATKFLNKGWGEDTGEPFCLVVGIGKTNGVFETDDTSDTHTISVYPKDAVRKIKAKYLPEEAATKEYVREQIAGIEVSGGSAAVTETEILPEQTLEAFVLNNVYGAYHKYLSPAPFTLNEGQEYIVIWDGISYTQTAFATYSDGSLCVVIGNTILTGTDSGEPFCIIYDATNGVAHFAATDNAESHTVRIYQQADIAVSWDNITGKPFGETKTDVTLFDGSYKYTYNETEGNWESEIIPVTSDVHLSVGDTCTVTWGGVAYTCEVFLLDGFFPCVGNSAVIGGEDNGYPFVIAEDSAGVISGIGGFVFMTDPDSTETTEVTYDIKLVVSTTTVVKLDNKYLDILEGEDCDTVEIFPEQTVEIDEYGESDHITLSAAISLGKTYTVVWNGVEYNCVAKIAEGYAFLGNPAAIGEDTGDEPFCMLTLGTDAVLFSEELSTSPIVRVYQPATSSTIKPELIPLDVQANWDETDKNALGYVRNKPFGTDFEAADEITSFEAVNLSTITASGDVAAVLEAAGLYAYLFDCPSEEQWTENKCTIGDIYALSIGEKVYYAEAKSLEGDFELGFGNWAILSEGAYAMSGEVVSLPDTGEDFLVIAINSVPNGSFSMYCRTNHGDSVSVSIHSTTETVTQIPRKYIPSPPEFDLTAMGLPALTLDGTEVSVECDTTELRAALDKGLVKLSFAANIGQEVTVTGVSNAMCINNDYQCGFVGYLSTPVVLNFMIQETKITGQILALATAT